MTRKLAISTSFIDNVILKWLDPLLTPLNFKRKGRVWNRQSDSIIHVLDVQESKSSTTADEQFTINVGAFSARIFESVWQRPAPRFVKETDCIVRVRIGDLEGDDLSGKTKDIWWTMDSMNVVDEVGKHAISLVKSKAIPFLDTINSNESMLETLNRIGGWQSKYPLRTIYLAALNAELGKLSNAAVLLDEAIMNSAWRDRAMSVKAFYRLTQ